MTDHIKSLILKHLREDITPAEQAELEDWLNRSEENRSLLRYLENPEQVASAMEKMERMREEAVWQRLQARTVIQKTAPPATSRVHRIRLIRRWSYPAAAAVLLIIAGIYLFHRPSMEKIPSPSGIPATADNIPPGRNKATLTLAGGRQIILDSAQDGALLQQDSIKIVKLGNGRLAYTAQSLSSPATHNLSYNTLSTPRGGQYQLDLPDGTKVWLNSASSITYPVAFTGHRRMVSVTGEAYFEIAKDKARPFLVKVTARPGNARGTAKDMDIEVLGTHFNVNAYQDESTVRTTLLEGSIRVSNNSGTRPPALLTVGQQAQVDAGGKIQVFSHVDLEETMAWKNGFFQFNRASLDQVMRQLSRWYDMDIVYEKNIPEMKFGGKMQRDLYLKDMLDILEKTDVHFRIDGRKIIVMP